MFRAIRLKTRRNYQGLTAEYHAGTNFGDYRYTSAVPDINYDTQYSYGSRPINPATGAWAARYTAKLIPAFTQTYTLYLLGEGRDRLYVNGALVIDAWAGHISENNYTIAMIAGQPVSIQVDFGADAVPRDVLVLSWSSPSVPKQIIPNSAFSTTI
jgi:mannan endo-1,4-beta-mannosidase